MQSYHQTYKKKQSKIPSKHQQILFVCVLKRLVFDYDVPRLDHRLE